MRSFSHAQIREISLPCLMTADFIARKQMWKIPSEPQNLGKVGRQLASLILVRKRKTTQTFTPFQAFISSYEQSKKDLQLCVSCLMTMSSLLLWLCDRGVKTRNKKKLFPYLNTIPTKQTNYFTLGAKLLTCSIETRPHLLLKLAMVSQWSTIPQTRSDESQVQIKF